MKQQAGFSILEILAVLAILGVVVFVANGFVQADVREHDRLQLAADQQRTARLGSELLREQIAPVGSGLSGNEVALHIGCTNKHLELYATYIDTTVEKDELRYWYFTVVADRTGARLTRATYNPTTMKNDARQPLVPGVAEVRLATVYNEWGSPLQAAHITAGTVLNARLIVLKVITDVGITTHTEVSLPLVPTMQFLGTWGPQCAA